MGKFLKSTWDIGTPPPPLKGPNRSTLKRPVLGKTGVGPIQWDVWPVGDVLCLLQLVLGTDMKSCSPEISSVSFLGQWGARKHETLSCGQLRLAKSQADF